MKEAVFHATKEQLQAMLEVLYVDNLRCAIVVDIMMQTGEVLGTVLGIKNEKDVVYSDTGMFFLKINGKNKHITANLAKRIVLYRNSGEYKTWPGAELFMIGPYGVAKAVREARQALGTEYKKITPSSFYTYFRDKHK